ncbi:MAG: conjugal transfer protein TraG, partial [Myxococcaceae bacterium]|nr:conjugal transfer protein TraG [Myxococcaceae bacterium]
MRTRNQTFDTFGPSRRPLSAFGHTASALGLFGTLQLVGWWIVTAWLAARLDYQPGLGDPWITVGATPLYAPWRHFLWRAKLSVVQDAQAVLHTAQHASELATIGAFGLSVWGAALYLRARRNRAGILHGSGGWATPRDLERANLLGDEGVVLGHWHDGKRLRVLHHNGPEGVLMFAPPRSGKGVGPIQSSLLTWKHSALVLDPKGENYDYTSGWRKHMGQKVYCLNFAASPEQTAGFNPLDTVRLGTEHEVADVQRLAQIIADPDGKQAGGQNAHWAETSAALLAGTILHVLYRERREGASAT